MQNLKIAQNTTSDFLKDTKGNYPLNNHAIDGTLNKKCKSVPIGKRAFKINLFTIYLYTIELLYTFYR